MLELLLVLGSLVGLCAIAFITVVVTPQLMIELGLWVLAVGLLIGIPTGLWYHVALYRELAPRMTLELPEAEREKKAHDHEGRDGGRRARPESSQASARLRLRALAARSACTQASACTQRTARSASIARKSAKR